LRRTDIPGGSTYQKALIPVLIAQKRIIMGKSKNKQGENSWV